MSEGQKRSCPSLGDLQSKQQSQVGTVGTPEASTPEAGPGQQASDIILQVRSLGPEGFLTPFCPVLTKSGVILG